MVPVVPWGATHRRMPLSPGLALTLRLGTVVKDEPTGKVTAPPVLVVLWAMPVWKAVVEAVPPAPVQVRVYVWFPSLPWKVVTEPAVVVCQEGLLRQGCVSLWSYR